MSQEEKTAEEEKAKSQFIEKRKQLRAKYGHVIYIETEIFNEEGESEIVGAWFKRMGRTASQAFQDLAEKSPMEAGDVAFKECWIEGDERIRTTEYIKDDMGRDLGRFLGQKISHIKKL